MTHPHEACLAACAAVIPTLTRPGEVEQVTVTLGGGDPSIAIRLASEGPFTLPLVEAPEDLTFERAAFRLFAELQDWLAESTVAWGEARPLCPGHRHPRRLEERGGRLWWVCPADTGRRERAFPSRYGSTPGS